MDSFKILTQIERGRAHQETEVAINWDGVSEEELRILARGFLVYQAQCQWRKDKKIPEKIVLAAAGQAHPYVPRTVDFPPPRPKEEHKDFGWLDELLQAMSDEDRQKFLASI